ncbi:S-adenosyl-L-methionine-dependent methyltransferase [Xylariomycetidae sp. FL2044]|nr:S-adenosyl-L-methionine-dependent methyltransferase [Xylariomycetidae sp. FL2044]
MADVYAENMTRLPSETIRLNEQFELMTKNMGYVLHPSVNLPRAPRIADMGTGTGRFLLCLQAQFPDAVFEGFDISPTLFPPQNALPSSVTLSVLDLKQPFPEHMHGRYDLVHLRLLVSGMRPEDWEPAVRNIFRVLRPGGYIQWEECEFINAQWLKSTPDARFETAKAVADAFTDALREQFRHGWNTLPGQMRDAGFTTVISDVANSDRFPETRAAMTASILSLNLTWVRMMTARGASGPLFNKHADDLEKAVHDDIESGGYFKFNIHIACAQKPLA